MQLYRCYIIWSDALWVLALPVACCITAFGEPFSSHKPTHISFTKPTLVFSILSFLPLKDNIALGITDAWEAANIRFDAGWVALESQGKVDRKTQYELVTGNLEKLLGMRGWFGEEGDLVIYQGGGPFELESKVVGVASPTRGVVEVF